MNFSFIYDLGYYNVYIFKINGEHINKKSLLMIKKKYHFNDCFRSVHIQVFWNFIFIYICGEDIKFIFLLSDSICDKNFFFVYYYEITYIIKFWKISFKIPKYLYHSSLIDI